MNCAICGQPAYEHKAHALGGRRGFKGISLTHPAHTDAELAETKQAVDLAARVLTAFVLIDMARRVVAA